MKYFIWDKELRKPLIREEIIIKESEKLPDWVDMEVLDKERNKKIHLQRTKLEKRWKSGAKRIY